MSKEQWLIDANAFKICLEEIRQEMLEEDTMSSNFAAEVIETVQDEYLQQAPSVDAIPIAVMKRAIAGIAMADQCDQAGRYDYDLRSALKTVLEWYGSPRYKETERRTHE